MERFGQDLLLLEKLAAGGMAEVYRAKQLGYGGFEKTIAVKRILPHYASSEEFKSMFRMEANLSGLLQHPNVVQVFTNGEHEGYLYLVMEFVDGRNLRQLLARADKKKVKIPVEIACHVIAEAAKGLEYAHNFVDEKTGQPLDIVHRDMSPQNIMLSYDGGVKIVDFGIAKAAARADMTRAGVLKGKFGYMSPEQAQGQKLDKRTDIFALGIILFELLTQRRLFTTDDDLRTLQLVRECRVPRPSRYNPAISPALDRIVMKALAREKSERYGTAGELYADLLRFMNQTYPKFIPTDFSKFMKKVFEEDILEDRKKREKMAAEAPARVVAPAGRSPAPPAAAPGEKASKKKLRGEEDTAFDEDMKTEISQLTDSNAFPAGPNEVEAQLEGQGAEFSAPADLSMPSIRVPTPDPEARPSGPSGTRVAGGEAKTRGAQEAAPAEPDPGAATQITQDIAHDILPPPEERGGGLDIQGPAEGFSLSLPQNMKVDSLPPPSESPLKNISAGNAQPLTLALHDEPIGGGYARGTPVRPDAVSPLGMRGHQKRSYGRMILYGTALVALVLWFVYQDPQSEEHLVADSSPGPTVPQQQQPTPAPTQTLGTLAQNPPATEEPLAREVASESPELVEKSPATPSVVAKSSSEPALSPAPASVPEPATAATDSVPQASVPDSTVTELAPAKMGYLTLNPRPRATAIYLDGKRLITRSNASLESPTLRYPVPEGKHRLRLENSAFKVRWESEIEVKGDKILSLEPTLQ